MTAPIKHCPQPDPPELVMRADGYHYLDQSKDDMSHKELTDNEVWDAFYNEGTGSAMGSFRAIIAADRALNAPADRDVMRQTPEGWKWVPVVPSVQMLNAGYAARHDLARAVYEDMLAAAPTPKKS